MTTKFIEPGTDATQNLSLFNGGTNLGGNGAAVASDSTQAYTGLRSLKANGGSAGEFAVINQNSVLQDSGTRVSQRIRLPSSPTGNMYFFQAQNSGGTRRIGLRITAGFVVQAFYYDGTNFTQIGTNGSTLSTNTWYQYTMSYTVTNATTNSIRVYKDGVLDITITNASIATTFVNGVWGWASAANDAGNSLSIFFDDFYIDDSSALTDVGNVRTTNKRSLANGTTNGFSTQIGAGGSGYGTGHAPQVNEQPLSNTNGWSMIGAGVAITEEYNVEGISVGDVDMTGVTIIDYMGWVDAKAALAETGQIIVNNVTSNIALTSTETVFTKAAGSTTYPAGTGTDIGIITSTTVTTVSLYECGIVFAYTPAAVAASTTPVPTLLSMGVGQ